MCAGARQHKACRICGIDERTLRRWRAQGPDGTDGRPGGGKRRKRPPNALSAAEKAAVVAVCNQPENASKPPTQIVTNLADNGVYIASESSFYRVLREHKQLNHRGRARAPKRRIAPVTYTATAPRQVWVWDITWLPCAVTGIFFKLYIIMDLFSRKIVAAEVFENENAENSKALLYRAALAENLAANAAPVVLHGDNGSPLRAGTVLALMEKLQLSPSHSRPRVSNDNAHAEALFRTAKYHPSLPTGHFPDINAARQWANAFILWYNHEHKHRSINFVTPHQKHTGEDIKLLAKRHQLYQQARDKNPLRWIQGVTRNCNPITTVSLNPPDTKELEKILKKSA